MSGCTLSLSQRKASEFRFFLLPIDMESNQIQVVC